MIEGEVWFKTTIGGDVKMMNKMSQKRTRTKTCGIAAKPLGKAKRIQTLLSHSLDKPQIKQQDAATQTVLETKNVDQEEGNDNEEAEVLEDDTRKDPDYEPDIEELHEEIEERKIMPLPLLKALNHRVSATKQMLCASLYSTSF
ncbi:uncharacterized protein LOC129278313 [Lytechinus pictus]|uniref:uncharacterized protein LOC129278313 n=1 Tax=Lytechinus pictus TaxID=7653 RepID=UPI0030BA13FE